jgi:hypothetical protein
METGARYPEFLRVRVPADTPRAVQRVARRHHQTGAEWMRQLILRELELEGVRVAQFSKPIEGPPWVED